MSAKGMIAGGVALVTIIIVVIIAYSTQKPAATTPATAPSAPPVAQIFVRPAVVYATTPATITADYEFNIETDSPINVEYPGEKPLLYTPGKGFTQLPQPRESGPKVFTDPNDPENGHIAFRLYPVHKGK